MGKFPNSGIISKNKYKKEGEDKKPDYTGTAEVDGKDYRLAGWVNDSQNGKYLKLAFSEVDETSQVSDDPF